MNRRTFVAAGVASVAGLSGCLNRSSGSGSDSYPTPEDGNTDGYPPKSAVDGAKKMNVDTSSFKTKKSNGQEVPLAPLDVAYNWFQRREARFADARGKQQYDVSHIQGAVLSPAPGINEELSEDPTTDWPKDARIVCYCGCPHHLSVMRAAELKNNGYENVFVIDEGFWKWHENGYPIRGNNTEKAPQSYVIDGVASAASAGQNAWARHEPSNQNEATDIDADGSYSLHVKFHDVTPDSTLVVQTPEYEIEGTIADLSSGVVSG